jgi:hypothetical protein
VPNPGDDEWGRDRVVRLPRRRNDMPAVCRAVATIARRSQVRRRCLCRRWQGVQSEDSSAWALIPGTTSTAAPARGWRPTRADDVDLPQIDCPARAAARAEHVKPRRSRDQRGPDRRRPQNVPAGDKLLIPALDDGLRFGARGGVGSLPFGTNGNVEAPRPHAHRHPAANGRSRPHGKGSI